MFSSRLPDSLAPNPISAALEQIRARGEPLIDLTESNPTRVGLRYPPGLLAPLGDDQALVYEPDPHGLPTAREAVAADYARRGIDVAPDRIMLTASTSEAYALLFKLLCDPGDRVLVPRPSYPLFDHLARFEAVKVDTYELRYGDRWSIDLDGLRRAVSWDTRAVFVVNPNNPTGSFVRPGELNSLATLCGEREMALVGDEVFADYVLERESERAATVLAQNQALCFSLGGLSKTVGLPQVKLGWMAVGGPAPAAAEAMRRLEILSDAYLSVSTPAQRAATRLLADGAAVREQIVARVTRNLASLGRAMGGVEGARVLRVEGGWCAVMQAPPDVPEETLVLDLLERERVLVHPGYFYEFADEPVLVVCLLPAPDEFDEAIRRIADRL